MTKEHNHHRRDKDRYRSNQVDRHPSSKTTNKCTDNTYRSTHMDESTKS